MTRALTDLFIRQLKPTKGKQVDYRDQNVKGLLLRVSPKGTKTFYVWYRVNGKAERFKLGKFGALSLADARKRALTQMSLVYDGKSPVLERRMCAARGMTFGALLQRHIDEHLRPNLRGAHEVERLLRKEFAKPWTKWPIGNVKREDVRAVIKAIQARGAPGAARKALAAIRKLFNWAIQEGHIAESPVGGVVASGKVESRDRVLTAEELGQLLRAARAMGYPYGSLIELLALTGQRRGEVSNAHYDEFNFDALVWKIPAARTKTNREHRLPLTGTMVSILNAIPRRASPLLFPSHDPSTPISGFSKWKRQIDSKSGVTNWEVRDLRRTVATNLGELDVDPHVIDAVLNHKTGVLSALAKRYNRWQYLPQMRAALELWEKRLLEIIETKQ